MKFLEWVERAAPLLKEIMPNKMIWAMIGLNYGMQVLIAIIYIVDWLIKGGARPELLLLLDKI